MGVTGFAEHGLRAAYRTPRGLGYAGFARQRDKVSTDHFLSELDKVRTRERRAK